MSKKFHIIYIAVIVLLSLFAFVSVRFGFKTAEQRVMTHMKSFYVSNAFGQRYAAFEGVWQIEGDNASSNLKHGYKYACNDADMTCIETDAYLNDDYLAFDSTKLEVTEWTDKQLIINDDAQCRTNTIVVDLLTEDVTMISKDVPNRNENLCKGLDVLTEPRKSKLVDGLKVMFPIKPK